MKILFLAQLPPLVHGASLASQSVLNYLKKEKCFKVEYFNISLAKNLASIGSPSFYKGAQFIFLLFKLTRALFLKKFDVVYITLSPHGWAFYKDSALLLISKMFIFRRIIHLHGKGISETISNSKWKKYFYNFVFRGCEVVHLSPLLLNDISDLKVSKKHIVNNGVPDIYITNATKKYDLVFLSNLYESKGILVFVEALCLLASESTLFTCAIVGKGGDAILRQIEKKFDSAGIPSQVSILGPLYEGRKSQILNSSRIFVLPTFNDCFPLSILEAMSAGLPVISTNVGAIPDIVDDTNSGILLEMNTPQCLANAIKSLLNNPVLVLKMGQTGRAKYLNKYTEVSFGESMISVFKSY